MSFFLIFKRLEEKIKNKSTFFSGYLCCKLLVLFFLYKTKKQFF